MQKNLADMNMMLVSSSYSNIILMHKNVDYNNCKLQFCK